jgi:hypothetical protein
MMGNLVESVVGHGMWTESFFFIEPHYMSPTLRMDTHFDDCDRS